MFCFSSPLLSFSLFSNIIRDNLFFYYLVIFFFYHYWFDLIHYHKQYAIINCIIFIQKLKPFKIMCVLKAYLGVFCFYFCVVKIILKIKINWKFSVCLIYWLFLPLFYRRQATSPGSPASLASHPVSLLSSADLSPGVQGTTLIQLQQCVAVTPQKGNISFPIIPVDCMNMFSK